MTKLQWQFLEKKGNNVTVLSNIVRSQIDVHKIYGGVVPELAARAHSDVIHEIIEMALKEAKLRFGVFMLSLHSGSRIAWRAACWCSSR